MLSTYTYPRYHSALPDPAKLGGVTRVPLVVVGAGPVGLCAAIDAAQRGQPVVLLDDDDTVSVGSRGLCYAKRTLEVLDRLGVGDAVVAKGVTWNVGRTFHRDTEVFHFNLLPEAEHRRPGMVNLQQYWLEQYLVERAQQLPSLDLRWRHKVVAVRHVGQGAEVDVEVLAPAGEATNGGSPGGGAAGVSCRYTLLADWLVVADGARSPIRRQLGLDVEGKVFQDRFLIADVVLQGELFAAERTERWFWFDPPFHPGQSVLLHREADAVWRIDFQLGWDADPEAEKQPERVIARIRAMLDAQGYGDIGFELEWVSVYTFQCRRMKRFRDRRVFFVGDAAHQVSPFGARGANSGIQDADNLMWKLALVLAGQAPEALLDSYSDERCAAADENLLESTRSTDFITPKSSASRTLRNAVLTLAREHPFGRALVNSGRLSVPSHHDDSPLNSPDDVDLALASATTPSTPTSRTMPGFDGWMRPGAPMDDAPVRQLAGPAVAGEAGGWLLGHAGHGFQLLLMAPLAQALSQLKALGVGAASGRLDGDGTDGIDGTTAVDAADAADAADVAAVAAVADPALRVLLVLPAADDAVDAAQSEAATTSMKSVEALKTLKALGDAGITVLHDVGGLVSRRYDLTPGSAYLLRPDHHVAARWRSPSAAALTTALARACARG